MATKRFDEELFQRLRNSGLRKRAARLIAENTGSRKPPKPVQGALNDLKKLVAEVEDRVSGGPARRRAAAKKAAATRRRKAQARSAAAKKGARTRAKSRS